MRTPARAPNFDQPAISDHVSPIFAGIPLDSSLLAPSGRPRLGRNGRDLGRPAPSLPSVFTPSLASRMAPARVRRAAAGPAATHSVTSSQALPAGLCWLHKPGLVPPPSLASAHVALPSAPTSRPSVLAARADHAPATRPHSLAHGVARCRPPTTGPPRNACISLPGGLPAAPLSFGSFNGSLVSSPGQCNLGPLRPAPGRRRVTQQGRRMCN
jgi:hypothetical protein